MGFLLDVPVHDEHALLIADIDDLDALGACAAHVVEFAVVEDGRRRASFAQCYDDASARDLTGPSASIVPGEPRS